MLHCKGQHSFKHGFCYKLVINQNVRLHFFRLHIVTKVLFSLLKKRDAKKKNPGCPSGEICLASSNFSWREDFLAVTFVGIIHANGKSL